MKAGYHNFETRNTEPLAADFLRSWLACLAGRVKACFSSVLLHVIACGGVEIYVHFGHGGRELRNNLELWRLPWVRRLRIPAWAAPAAAWAASTRSCSQPSEIYREICNGLSGFARYAQILLDRMLACCFSVCINFSKK